MAADMASEDRPSIDVDFQRTLRAAAPFMAAHWDVATTAAPPGIGTTCSTPFTTRVALSSNPSA